MSCDYCYNCYNNSGEIIDIDLVEQIIDKAFKDYSIVEFVWRGGEPLLMNKKFYRKVVILQRRYSYLHGTSFTNSIQTNGTLLDRKWIRLLKKHGFNLGISFDGATNDIHRGKSEQTLKAFKLCKRLKYPIGSISVVTNENIDLIALYDYMKSKVNSMKFTPCFKTIENDHSIDTVEYIDKLKKLFDYWITDKSGAVISPIDNYVRYVMGIYSQRECTHASCLGRFVDVDSQGLVRVCSHVRDTSFELDYIYNYSTIPEIFNGEKFNALLRLMIEKRSQCKATCKYFGFCEGGCCSEEFMKKGSDTFTCRVIKQILPYISVRLSDIFSSGANLENFNPNFKKLVEEAVCKNPIYFNKYYHNQYRVTE